MCDLRWKWSCDISRNDNDRVAQKPDERQRVEIESFKMESYRVGFNNLND